jgi:hypothetical protein
MVSTEGPNPHEIVTITTYSAADGMFYLLFDLTQRERHGNGTELARNFAPCELALGEICKEH